MSRTLIILAFIMLVGMSFIFYGCAKSATITLEYDLSWR